MKYGKSEFILNETHGNEITNKEFNYTAGNFIMWVMKKGTYGGRMLMCYILHLFFFKHRVNFKIYITYCNTCKRELNVYH